VSEDEEQDRRGSREIEVEWGAREAIDTFDGRLYHKVAISS